jgi:hypothetical protein
MVRSTPEKGQRGFLTLDDGRVLVEFVGEETQKGTQGWRFKKVGTNEIVFIENSKIGRGVGWWPRVPEEGRGAAAGGKRPVLNDPNINTASRRYNNTEEGTKTKNYRNPTYGNTRAKSNSTPPVVSSSTGGSRWNPFDGTKTTFRYQRNNPVFIPSRENNMGSVMRLYKGLDVLAWDEEKHTYVRAKVVGKKPLDVVEANQYKIKLTNPEGLNNRIDELENRTWPVHLLVTDTGTGRIRPNREAVFYAGGKFVVMKTTKTTPNTVKFADGTSQPLLKVINKKHYDMMTRAEGTKYPEPETQSSKGGGKKAAKNAAEKAAKNAAEKAAENAAEKTAEVKSNAAKNAAEKAAKNAAKNAVKNAAASEAAVGRSKGVEDSGKGDNSGKNAAKNAVKNAVKNGNAAATEATAVGRSGGSPGTLPYTLNNNGGNRGGNGGKNAKQGRLSPSAAVGRSGGTPGTLPYTKNAAAPAVGRSGGSPGTLPYTLDNGAAAGRSAGGSPGTLPYTEAKKEAKNVLTSGTTKLKQASPEGTLSSTDDDTDQKKPASTEVLEFMAAPFGALVTICGSFLSMAWIGRSYY